MSELRTSGPEDITAVYRERIWDELLRVGRPDSRFHWDFSSFIADFEGSDRCAERVMGVDAYRSLGDRRLFITPDNSIEEFRRRCILDGRSFAMTTYGIVRGFLWLDVADVPKGEERYAATLDGMDRYARPASLAQLAEGPTFGLLVTGGSAVSRNGMRFGKGHGYFDFEFATLSEIGVATHDSVIVDVVHDCQYVDEDLPAKAHDVPVDWIVTPTRTIEVDNPDRGPGKIHWALVAGTQFERLAVVAELRALKGTR